MSNDHASLCHALQGLILQDARVDGAESLLTDVLGKLKQAGGYVGDEALKGITQVTKAAVTGIVKTLGTRRMMIGHLHNRLGKDPLKSELTFNAALLKKITRNGKPDDIIDGLDDLQKTMELIKSFLQDVEVYSSKEMALLERIGNVKNTDDAVKLLDGLEALSFPHVKLPVHSGNSSVSDDLPGGKTIWYNETNNKLSLMNVSTPGEEVTESFAESDVKTILTKLNKLVEIYQYVVKALNQYESYMKKFNTVLSKSFAHLDVLKGTLSASLLADMRSHLEGNTKVFALYSGFLPQLMIYIDDYVDTLSSYLSKQFN